MEKARAKILLLGQMKLSYYTLLQVSLYFKFHLLIPKTVNKIY